MKCACKKNRKEYIKNYVDQVQKLYGAHGQHSFHNKYNVDSDTPWTLAPLKYLMYMMRLKKKDFTFSCSGIVVAESSK